MHYIETKLREFLAKKFPNSKIHENRDMIWVIDDAENGVVPDLMTEFLNSILLSIPTTCMLRLCKYYTVEIACNHSANECDIEYTFYPSQIIDELVQMGYCYV